METACNFVQHPYEFCVDLLYIHTSVHVEMIGSSDISAIVMIIMPIKFSQDCQLARWACLTTTIGFLTPVLLRMQL